ncbi:universal stress protein [Kitasatospora sp. NPDC052896]|uniref:universal stress protein n=1 Tax=Kitasatospora sp. NPDC052896 TaxID=3364061 RepID=UPI0037C84AF9
MSDKASVPRIVVGVDGSESSEEALRWAVRQAALVGATVDALIAWDYPRVYGWPAPTVETFDYEENARKVLAETISKAVGPEPPVEISSLSIQGDPATALLDAARGATLLVVGNRGHGGFTGALLGSVSQRCVHHAHCPVVIVRDTST